jgi:hypothetical protein
MKNFIGVWATVACALIIFPIHPLFPWVFAVIGAFVVSKLVIDKLN